MRHDPIYFWEAVVLAAIASGRKTAQEAAQIANELVSIREKRWPEEERSR